MSARASTISERRESDFSLSLAPSISSAAVFENCAPIKSRVSLSVIVSRTKMDAFNRSFGESISESANSQAFLAASATSSSSSAMKGVSSAMDFSPKKASASTADWRTSAFWELRAAVAARKTLLKSPSSRALCTLEASRRSFSGRASSQSTLGFFVDALRISAERACDLDGESAAPVRLPAVLPIVDCAWASFAELPSCPLVDAERMAMHTAAIPAARATAMAMLVFFMGAAVLT